MGLYHSPRIVTDGLVLCLDVANPRSYPGSGTTWTDLSDRGNNGTLTNGPTYNSSNGGSIVFDGLNDYIENLSPNLGITGNASITMSCWFYDQRLSTTTFQALFCYGNGPSAGDTFAIGLVNLGVNMQFNGGNVTSSNNNVYSLNTWNNVVVTKTPGVTNTTTKLYLNGVQLSIPSSTSITPNVTSRVVRVGRWTNDSAPSYFQGRVSNCLIYNKALTALEVQQNFAALRGRYGI